METGSQLMARELMGRICSGERVPEEVAHGWLDALEVALVAEHGGEVAVDGQLSFTGYVHEFFPGIYKRRLAMRAGTWGTSLVHDEEHPWMLMKGRVLVWDVVRQAVQDISAPYEGRTVPGVRRVLFVLEDAVWITLHHNPDDGHDVGAIGRRILRNRDQSLEQGEAV